MKDGRKYSYEEIEIISKSMIGKSLHDFENLKLITIDNKNNKGGLGQLVECILKIQKQS